MEKSEKKEMQLSPDGKQAGQAQINKIKMKSEETKPAYRYINEKSPRKLGYACVMCLYNYSTVSATSFSLSIVQYTHTHIHTYENTYIHVHMHISTHTLSLCFSFSVSLSFSLSLSLSRTHKCYCTWRKRSRTWIPHLSHPACWSYNRYPFQTLNL